MCSVAQIMSGKSKVCGLSVDLVLTDVLCRYIYCGKITFGSFSDWYFQLDRIQFLVFPFYVSIKP